MWVTSWALLGQRWRRVWPLLAWWWLGMTAGWFAPLAWAAPPLAAGRASEEVALVNQLVRQGWSDYGVKPAAAADEGQWVRRLFLDLLGRIPTVTELDEARGARSSRGRAELVDKLLDDPTYAAQYARHFTTVWANWLIGRSGGSERNSLINRRGLEMYLHQSLMENKPYDRMVLELVTATGSNTPGTENFNGAVNFLTMKLDDEAAQATAQTARLFLGLQIQCTQCHNHPFNDWKQQKYWELNAFFRQARSLRRFQEGGRQVAAVELVNQDFAGEGTTPEEAETYYELRHGVLQVAYPVFVDGREIPRSGYLQDVDRRAKLGELMLESEYLAKAMVNRLWGHFLGYGFTRPVDDMGPHNRPSHPELLEQLSQRFRAVGFDVKQLIRWIVLSEAYLLSSGAGSGEALQDDPTSGESPKFARFYLRQMTAEQLYDSLQVAFHGEAPSGGLPQDDAQRQRWLDQFARALGNDEGEEVTSFNGGIPQILMMLNGQLVRDGIALEQGNLVWKAAIESVRFEQKVDYLFRAALARSPQRAESAMARKLAAARGAEAAALQDLWWALLNSNEFLFNH